MTYQLSHDDKMRLIGSTHSLARVLVHLRRNHIAPLVGGYAPRIPAHHRRKLAEREMKLKALRELESWLVTEHASGQAAYNGQTAGSRICAETVP